MFSRFQPKARQFVLGYQVVQRAAGSTAHSTVHTAGSFTRPTAVSSPFPPPLSADRAQARGLLLPGGALLPGNTSASFLASYPLAAPGDGRGGKAPLPALVRSHPWQKPTCLNRGECGAALIGSQRVAWPFGSGSSANGGARAGGFQHPHPHPHQARSFFSGGEEPPGSPYRILNIPRSATKKEVKMAYLEAARTCVTLPPHPTRSSTVHVQPLTARTIMVAFLFSPHPPIPPLLFPFLFLFPSVSLPAVLNTSPRFCSCPFPLGSAETTQT